MAGIVFIHNSIGRLRDDINKTLMAVGSEFNMSLYEQLPSFLFGFLVFALDALFGHCAADSKPWSLTPGGRTEEKTSDGNI